MDVIVRQVAIDAVESTDWYHINSKGEMVSGANSAEHQPWYKAEDIYKVLEELPSAQPDRKPGRWIHWDDEPEHNAYECSECRKAIVLISGTPADNGYDFCPGCGASMKGTTSYYKLHGKKDD